MLFSCEELEIIFMEAEERMTKTADVLVSEYSNVRTGRANPHILDKITVDYYGMQSPLNQVGNIAVPESRMITIAPWDSSMLSKIEKAILAANIGLTPSNDGKIIRLVFPELTGERRKELSKKCKVMAEDSKVALRNVRRDSIDKIKKLKTGKKITEDESANCEKEMDKITAKYIEKIEKIYADKDKEVMSV